MTATERMFGKFAGAGVVRAAIFFAVFVVFAGSSFAVTYRVSLPAYEGNPDGLVRVPVELSDASGLASVRVQVNFDAELLTLEGAVAGTLGEAFDFSYEVGDGAVTLVFVRPEAMPAGGGTLAQLVFRPNAGATEELFSHLTVAVFEIGDTSGVVDLPAVCPVETSNGSVAVNFDEALSNRSTGMPDAWQEVHGINPLTSSPQDDSDGDGLVDVLEFAFGGNPKMADSQQRTPAPETVEDTGAEYLALSFRRPQQRGNLVYEVQESDDLVNWTTVALESRLLLPPQAMGDGSEEVVVRAGEPQGTRAKQFLRVRVRW